MPRRANEGEELIIHDGFVERRKVTVMKRIKLSSFLAEVQKSTSFQTPLLPHGTILYKTAGEREAILVERPPETRTINYEGTRYRLGLPFLYIGASFINRAINGTYLYFRGTPVTQLEDKLLQVALPNVYAQDYGKVCMGDFFADPAKPISEQVNEMVVHIDGAPYNRDLAEFSLKAMPQELVTKAGKRKITTDPTHLPLYLDAWKKLTEEGSDPCKWRWKTQFTVAEFAKLSIRQEE